jgi:uncharacterized protein with beta-barrel porin domain
MTGTLGVRAEGKYATSIGTWGLRVRVEFRRQFNRTDEASLAYADLAAAGPAYTVHTASQGTGNGSAGLGTRLLMWNGLTFTIEYSSNIDMSNGRSQPIMFGIAVPLH